MIGAARALCKNTPIGAASCRQSNTTIATQPGVIPPPPPGGVSAVSASILAPVGHRSCCNRVALSGGRQGNGMERQGLLYFCGMENHGNHGNRPELKITEITENHRKSRSWK